MASSDTRETVLARCKDCSVLIEMSLRETRGNSGFLVEVLDGLLRMDGFGSVHADEADAFLLACDLDDDGVSARSGNIS